MLATLDLLRVLGAHRGHILHLGELVPYIGNRFLHDSDDI